MAISFSAITSIDFSNQENLIFLGFAVFFFIILIIALLSLLKSLIKLFKTLIRARNYYLPSINKQDENEQEQLQPKAKNNSIKKEAEILRSKSQIVVPEKKSIVSPTIDYITPKKKIEQVKEKVGDAFSSKEKKDIEKGLVALKGSAKTDNGKASVESRMPQDKQLDEKELFEKISVSTSKLHTNNNEGSLFGVGQGLSRKELKNELRNNPEVWKQAKAAGLTLGRAGRANLINDIPKALKGSVSKGDLKKTIRVLRQKLSSSASSPQEHAKLRKEINFFKKLKEL